MDFLNKYGQKANPDLFVGDMKLACKRCPFNYTITVLICLLLAYSCVPQPDAPALPETAPGAHGAYILCEGLWGSNNSSLVRYDIDSGIVIPSYYSLANPGLSLGDVANSIAVMGDTAFIAVTTSRTIEIIRVSDGKSLGRIIMEGRRAPRRIYIHDRSRAYVSDLYDNSLMEFSPETFKVTRDKIPVGPSPEGVSGYGGYIFTANSGYGDYYANMPGAGTISVIDAASGAEIKRIYAGPDVIECTVNQANGHLYAAYMNLPSRKDSAGGIVEFDLLNLRETRRMEVPGFDLTRLAFSSTGDTLFYINIQGVAMVNLRDPALVSRQLITNPNSGEFWTALAYQPQGNRLWIGNGRNYDVNGEVLIYSLSPEPVLLSRFEAGVIPNTIVFF